MKITKKNIKVSIIIPTLNEEKFICKLLESLKTQTYNNFEIVVVDGGSKDGTVKISNKYNAKVIIKENCGEFPSRNIGVDTAMGDILLFTCADVIFPKNLIAQVINKFQEKKEVVAISGPGYLIDSPKWGIIEYTLYNKARVLSAKIGIISTSTNFLAVKKNAFENIGGFENDVNGDGILGKKLAKYGKVYFDNDIYVFISARRLWKMGFIGFNIQFIYVLENFLPLLSNSPFFKKLKMRLNNVHKQLHK